MFDYLMPYLRIYLVKSDGWKISNHNLMCIWSTKRTGSKAPYFFIRISFRLFFGFIPTLSVTYFPKLLMKMFWYSLSTLWKKTPKCPTINLVQQIQSSKLNVSLWHRVQWAIYVILLRSFLHPCATAEYLPSTYFYRWYKWRTGLPYSDINLRLDEQSYENIIHNCHRHVFINNQNMGPEFFQ